MNRFLVVFLLLVVGIAGLGYYLGWFSFATEHSDQKSTIKFTIDEDKIRKDKDKATEKVQEAGQKVKEAVGTGTEKAKDKISPP